MVTPENTKEDIRRVVDLLVSLPDRESILPSARTLSEGEAVLTPREAMLSLKETVSVKDALGRICATPSVSCPPAVPVAVCGERITEEHIRLFEQYGTEKIEVVK